MIVLYMVYCMQVFRGFLSVLHLIKLKEPHTFLMYCDRACLHYPVRGKKDSDGDCHVSSAINQRLIQIPGPCSELNVTKQTDRSEKSIILLNILKIIKLY